MVCLGDNMKELVLPEGTKFIKTRGGLVCNVTEDKFGYVTFEHKETAYCTLGFSMGITESDFDIDVILDKKNYPELYL